MTARLSDLICRICLKQDDIMVNIYKRINDKQTDLCTLLQRCGNLEVKRNDSYPKYLCQECTQDLLISAKFRDKCDKTEQVVKERCLRHLEEEGALYKKLVETDQQTRSSMDTDDLIEFDPIDSNDSCELPETTALDDADASDSRDNDDGNNDSDNSVESEGTTDSEKKNAEAEQPKGDYYCDECDHNFKSTRSLKIHVKLRHRGLPCYECPQCGVCFTKQTNFTDHTCQKPKDCDLLYGAKDRHRCVYCCVHCFQCLKTATSLLEHLPTHAGEIKVVKPIKKRPPTPPKATNGPTICSICQRSFAKAAHLKLHLLAHTAERKYACKKCDRCFTRKGNLKMHERSRYHTGTRYSKSSHATS